MKIESAYPAICTDKITQYRDFYNQRSQWIADRCHPEYSPSEAFAQGYTEE